MLRQGVWLKGCSCTLVPHRWACASWTPGRILHREPLHWRCSLRGMRVCNTICAARVRVIQATSKQTDIHKSEHVWSGTSRPGDPRVRFTKLLRWAKGRCLAESLTPKLHGHFSKSGRGPLSSLQPALIDLVLCCTVPVSHSHRAAIISTATGPKVWAEWRFAAGQHSTSPCHGLVLITRAQGFPFPIVSVMAVRETWLSKQGWCQWRGVEEEGCRPQGEAGDRGELTFRISSLGACTGRSWFGTRPSTLAQGSAAVREAACSLCWCN